MAAKHKTNPISDDLFTGISSRNRVHTEEPDFKFLHPLKPTVVFSTYWRFAVERQEVYFRRVCGGAQPWSGDPLLRIHKFTNAYRAADRVSQYLIRHVIGDDEMSVEDTFLKVLLFKIFNRIETWELLVENFGEVSAKSFDVDKFDRLLNQAFARGERLYSAAYIMPSGGRSGFKRKHRMHLHLLKDMLKAGLPQRISKASSMAQAFLMLRACPTLGDFLAYQYVTDLNYSRICHFEETEFVVAGPGAKGGLQKCFSDLGGLSEAGAIRLVADKQNECLGALGLRFPTLWGRPLQLIDCQNLFCEVNKYARVAHPEFPEKAGRTRIKQKLRPTGPLPPPKFPAKWGLNNRLEEAPLYVPAT